ncbi:hypothetical protein KCU65_g9514, partial [Aureobasidium melanogenum]
MIHVQVNSFLELLVALFSLDQLAWYHHSEVKDKDMEAKLAEIRANINQLKVVLDEIRPDYYYDVVYVVGEEDEEGEETVDADKEESEVDDEDEQIDDEEI